MLEPRIDLDRVVDAHARFLAAIGSLTDEQARLPSGLPDWTVGHVLSHVARNADSHVRRTRAAIRGELVDQYPGGLAGRRAEIEAGAHRPANDIIEDVRRTSSAVEEAWQGVTGEVWSGLELPGRRWQELEVHLIDLGIGVTYRDWPDEFVVEWLPRTRERMWDTLSPEARAFRFDSPAAQLAWLYGRLQRADAPDLPPWG